MSFTCNICGGTDYDESDGLYFCNECGTQSQEMHVQVVSTEPNATTGDGVGRELKQLKATNEKSETKKKLKGRPWTIYEGYQCVILAQVKALQNLGASSSLTRYTYRTWANYLHKLGVAFCKNEKLIPDVVRDSGAARMRELFHNTIENPENKKRSTAKGTAKRKAVDETEDDKNEKQQKIEITETGDRRKKDKAYRSPEYMTLQKTIAITFIGLQITDPDILDIDVVRWVYEGKVPFFSAASCLNDDMKLSGDDYRLFRGTLSLESLRLTVRKLAKFLGLKKQKQNKIRRRQQFCSMLRRFVAELNLPESIITVSENLFGFLKEPDFGCPPQDLAFAFIVLSMKFLFGLDDVKEWRLSELSTKLQTLVAPDVEVFVWKDWVAYTNRQKRENPDAYAVLSAPLSACGEPAYPAAKFIQCYKNLNRDKVVLSTNSRYAHHDKEFFDQLRNPLEMGRALLDRISPEQKDSNETEAHTELPSFTNASLAHIADIPSFEEIVSSTISEQKQSEVAPILEELSKSPPKLFSYKKISNEQELDRMRHSTYIWLLRVCGRLLLCDVMELDKLVVMLLACAQKLSLHK